MKKCRDMTKAQFDAALQRAGIVRSFFGYYELPGKLHVYAANAGSRRRAQLAYLLSKLDQSI